VPPLNQTSQNPIKSRKIGRKSYLSQEFHTPKILKHNTTKHICESLGEKNRNENWRCILKVKIYALPAVYQMSINVRKLTQVNEYPAEISQKSKEETGTSIRISKLNYCHYCI
jgi:hypothetical protein